MDKTNLINAMHDVLLDYCITTLRTKKVALAGHKDDFTAFDYGAYIVDNFYLGNIPRMKKSKKK